MPYCGDVDEALTTPRTLAQEVDEVHRLVDPQVVMLVALLLGHAHTNAGCSKLVGAGTFDNGHYNDDDHQMNVVDRFVPGTVPERLWAEPYNTSYPDGTGPLMYAASNDRELVFLLLGDLELRSVVTVNITSGASTSVRAPPSATWVFRIRPRGTGKPFHAVATQLSACGTDPYGPGGGEGRQGKGEGPVRLRGFSELILIL